MAKNLCSDGGFSILEVIVVIAVLAICLIPLMAMFPVQLGNSRHLENYTQDISLATKKTDEFKSILYNNFGKDFLLSELDGDFTSEGFTDFRFQAVITPENRTLADTICNLTVKVWRISDPGDDFEVSTKIARR